MGHPAFGHERLYQRIGRPIQTKDQSADWVLLTSSKKQKHSRVVLRLVTTFTVDTIGPKRRPPTWDGRFPSRARGQKMGWMKGVEPSAS